MKVIAPNYITAVSTTSEDADYPIENVLNNSPQDIYKAAATGAQTVTLTVSQGAALGVFNTNAESISLTVRDGETDVWGSGDTWGAGDTWTDPEVAIDGNDLEVDNDVGRLWSEWAHRDAQFYVDLECTPATGEYLEIGAIRCGDKMALSDVMLSFRKGIVMNSVFKRKRSGGVYFRKRKDPRWFQIRWRDTWGSHFEYFVDAIDAFGPEPLAYLIIDEVDGSVDARWLGLFTYENSPPEADFQNIRHAINSIKLVEVV